MASVKLGQALWAHLSLTACAWSSSGGRWTWTAQPLLISDPAFPSQLSGWIIELSWLLAKAGLGVFLKCLWWGRILSACAESFSLWYGFL